MKFLIILCAFVFSLSARTQSAEWSYSFPSGPSQWGTLAGYSTCALGAGQSPVAFETGAIAGISNVTRSSELPEIIPDVSHTSHRPFFNGHTVEVPLEGNSFLWQGSEYSALQFHFHSPSEHFLNEKQHPLEAHFVFRNPIGKLLVIGVFFSEGGENESLASVWRSLSEPEITEVDIDLTTLLPTHYSYFTYNGSLTTPPCTEGVTWIVLSESVSAGSSQLRFLQKLTGGPNNRPVQSVNDRSFRTNVAL